MSAKLILMSNATVYGGGQYGVQSGLVAKGLTFIPNAAPVPDGGAILVLLSLAGAALGVARRHLRS